MKRSLLKVFRWFLIIATYSFAFYLATQRESASPVVVPPIPSEHELTFDIDWSAFIQKCDTISGVQDTVIKKDGSRYFGFSTTNRKVVESLIRPVVERNLSELKRLPIQESINYLTLLGYQIFHRIVGRSFYRWGGDILDIDDPQEKGSRYQYRYGLDCSGFATMPYELAVQFGILSQDDPGALFSSKGFRKFSELTGRSDKSGRNGTSNNYRVDTQDLDSLGRVVFVVPRGGSPTAEQMNQLQPGDLAGKPGHTGIIVRIKGKLYYLESGGWVVPQNHGLPYPAREALTLFARRSPVRVRRALADEIKPQAGMLE